MLPGSALFFDVCAQRDFWPGGAWPMMDDGGAQNVAMLFALAAELGIRQGGIRCVHALDAPLGTDAPSHAVLGTPGADAAPGCMPLRPVALVTPGERLPPAMDRAHSYYVATGCSAPPDRDPQCRAVVDHLTAGVRDAIVFGAALETGLAEAVDACLRRRLRTHVVLDAAAMSDAARAQELVAGWKRRGVDGLTTPTVVRLLRRPAN